MGAPKPPNGWVLEEPAPAPRPPAGWELEGASDATTSAPAEDVSPPWLREAITSGRAKRVGTSKVYVDKTPEDLDLYEIQTPQGPGRVDARGRYIPSEGEQAQTLKTAAARRRLGGMDTEANGGLPGWHDALAALDSGGYGLSDELAGAAAATDPRALMKSGKSPLEAYRAARDAQRAAVKDSRAKAGLVPQLVGAVPSMLVGAPGSAVGRVVLAGLMGGAQAAGDSEADLTQGEAGKFAGDVAGRALLSASLGAGAEAVTAPLSALARRTAQEAGGAKAAQFAEDLGTRTARGASTRGSAGSAGRTVIQTIQEAMATAADPNASHEELTAAQSILSSPEAREAIKRARLNKFASFFTDSANADQLRSMAAEQLTDTAGKAAADAASKMQPGAIAGELGGKLWRSVGQRAALAAGGAAVGAVAGPALGMDRSTAAGGGAMAGLITPGMLQFARNQVANPRAQFAANQLVSTALKGGVDAARAVAPVAGRFIDRDEWAAVQKDLESGGGGLGLYSSVFRGLPEAARLATHIALMRKDPEYAAKVRALVAAAAPRRDVPFASGSDANTH